MRVHWIYGCVPHRLQFPAGSRTGHGRGGRVVGHDCRLGGALLLLCLEIFWREVENVFMSGVRLCFMMDMCGPVWTLGEMG